ncbi:4Fe-4S binding protein, partial [Gordonibacter sp.]
MSWGFFFDNTRCTGCRTCEMACKDYHDLDASLTYRR